MGEVGEGGKSVSVGQEHQEVAYHPEEGYQTRSGLCVSKKDLIMVRP